MTNSKKKKVLILCYSDLNRDPRVRRQAEWLREDYDVTLAGFAPIKDINVRFIPITPPDSVTKAEEEVIKLRAQNSFHLSYPVLIRKVVSVMIRIKTGFSHFFYKLMKSEVSRFEDKYWYTDTWHGRNRFERIDFINSLKQELFDIIIGNDIDSIPLALKIAERNRAKVVFDAHEYYPDESANMNKWAKDEKQYVVYLCQKYIPKVDLMLTVSDGIAKKYNEEFSANPLVITNACKFEKLEPSTPNPERIQLIHHGLCVKAREVDILIEMMEYIEPRFFLTLMLMPVSWDIDYYESIKKRIAGSKNIVLVPPVPTSEIAKTINRYDVGVHLLRDVSHCFIYALPNKLFEFIQARLAIAIGFSPAMADIVQKRSLGVVSGDYTIQSLAKAINSLTIEQIVTFKQHANDCAFELSAEQNKVKLMRELSKF